MSSVAAAASAAAAAQETLDIVFELSRLLDTGLDRETTSVLVSLVQAGVHPEALARCVKELKREAGELREARAAAGLMPEASEGEPPLGFAEADEGLL